MIKINDVEILTVEEGLNWGGSKDTVARTFNFSFLYSPLNNQLPKYYVKVGDKVEWVENNVTLFYGYVEKIDYSTDTDKINISCVDLMVRLLRSKCIGRFTGTLTELANNICGLFGLKNGIENDSTHKHNIVSDGDLSYYEILDTALKSMFERYTLYLEGTTLKLATDDVVATFEIGKNIRTSSFSQDLSNMVTKVLIIDKDGNLINSVQNDEAIQQFGLFQEVYNYKKDIKNNIAEASKLLKTVENEATLTVNNDNKCITGRYVKVIEPVNNFIGIFEIYSDDHTIGADSPLNLEISFVRAAEEDEQNNG